MEKEVSSQTLTDELPSALDKFNEIKARAIGKRSVGVFLDYDGTLTPIVRHPEDAVLLRDMRQILNQLSRRCMMSIISGRDLKDVQKLVGIKDIYYAGSHGFEVAGPGGWREEYPEAARFHSVLDQTEKELHSKLDKVKGMQIERKRYSIAVHYRGVAEGDIEKVERGTRDILQEREDELRISSGKCVYDFQPKIEWHKGKALDWLLKKAFWRPDEAFPLYIGDDITDEDGFRTVKDRGIAIVVRDDGRPTEAVYALESPAEVGRFLEAFGSILPACRW
jgi:trehalose-phosphatase